MLEFSLIKKQTLLPLDNSHDGRAEILPETCYFPTCREAGLDGVSHLNKHNTKVKGSGVGKGKPTTEQVLFYWLVDGAVVLSFHLFLGHCTQSLYSPVIHPPPPFSVVLSPFHVILHPCQSQRCCSSVFSQSRFIWSVTSNRISFQMEVAVASVLSNGNFSM